MRLMTEGEDYPLAAFPDYEKKDLRALAFSIEHENGMMEIASLTVVHHAVRCGKALHAAKSKVPHGSWMQWIEDNTTLPHSTVNMFMTLASNSQRVENSESIRGALKLLADDRAEERRSKAKKYVPYDGEKIAPSPAPRPSPAPASEATIEPKAPATPKSALPLGATYQDAEILEPEYDECAVRLAAEHGVTPSEVVNAGLFVEAAEKLGIAEDIRTGKETRTPDEIIAAAFPAESARFARAEAIIEEKRKEAYPMILSLLPFLTKAEIKSLSEILTTRWS